jgi:hypothetical protein
MKGAGRFQLAAAMSSNSAEMPVDMGGDSLPTPPSRNERQQPQSRNLNENKGFTNSRGEPIKQESCFLIRVHPCSSVAMIL